MYRESRGLKQGGKIRAYGWSWDNPGRNSVVRERENRRVVPKRESGESGGVVQTLEHLTVGESGAQRKMGDVSFRIEANNWR